MYKKHETTDFVVIREYHDQYCYGLEYIIDELLNEHTPVVVPQQAVDWFGLHDLTVQ